MKLKFSGECIVEATSPEDALNQLANYLSRAARRLGNEQELKDIAPFFTLTAAAENVLATDLSDKLPAIEHVSEPAEEPVK